MLGRLSSLILFVAFSEITAALLAQAPRPPVLELRVYTLKPGIRDSFHARFVQESLPLLQHAHIDVVAYGPSLHDADSWYLLRSFASED